MQDKLLEDLAGEVVRGDSSRALAQCAADPALAVALSPVVARRLVEEASSHVAAVDPEEHVWPGAQDGVVALAAVPGADAQALAGALLQCCVFEPVSGESDQLGDAGLRLILDHHAQAVEQLFEFDPLDVDTVDVSLPWPSEELGSTRFLVDAMWSLPGAEGAEWMDRALDHHPSGTASRRPRAWSTDGWIARLDVLTDRDEIPQPAYAVEFGILRSESPAPRAAAPALARYACSHFAAGKWDLRRHLSQAADVLARHRTGDAQADVELFWWDAQTEEEIAALRWLLELVGPAGTRASLVDAAATRGLVGPSPARNLVEPLARPLWADRDVPWVVTEVVEGGVLEVTDAPAIERLGADRLWTRAVVAVHPVHGRADAATEWLVEPHAMPLRWEPAGDGLWLGLSEDGSVARGVRDLGVLDLGLTIGDPPWFVHDRVPPDEGDDGPEPAAPIGSADLLLLALDGVSLRRQRRALRAALHQRGVGEYASAVVMRHVRDGIGLGSTFSRGRSRLGGDGRLPAGTPWPALSEEDGWYLAPILELALDELPAVDPLPADGTLLVFAETQTWGMANPLAGTRVIYVPAGVELHEATPPGTVVFPLGEKPLRGIAIPVPGETQLVLDELELVEDRQRTIDAMSELMRDWWPQHWILGSSVDVQGPARLDVAYTLEQAPAETRARFTADELEPGAWALLALINEDHEIDLGIGDGGTAYLYILRRDLAERRFDRVVGFTQSH